MLGSIADKDFKMDGKNRDKIILTIQIIKNASFKGVWYDISRNRARWFYNS